MTIFESLDQSDRPSLPDQSSNFESSIGSANEIGELRPIQFPDTAKATSMTMQMLVQTPVFAALPFGIVSKLVFGQVNRGHYFFATKGKSIVGYVGWALASREIAEAWLDANQPFPEGAGREGEIICLNMWLGKGRETNRQMVRLLEQINPEQTHIFGRRFYANGKVRSTRVKTRQTNQAN